jgi:hypothetical protein
MLRTSLAIALALLVVPACKKKEGEGGGKPAESGKTADKPAEGAKPAEGGDKPKEMSATDLFADYNKPGQDGMALLDKWRAGVIVTGDVKNVVGEDTVWLNAGEGVNLSVGFADGGKAMKEKGLKAGDKVAAKCSIGGSDGKLMMLTDCELK